MDEVLEVGAALEFRESSIHNRGAFAKERIKRGAPVIEYVGEKITKAESAARCEANNPYIFNFDDEFDLDGDVGWNPAKFINHSCAPNCEAEFFGDQIWIMARREIKPGDEITFNYSYSLEDYKEHPCRCGAATCVGYMVAAEHFPELKRREKAARQKEKNISAAPPLRLQT